jgi:hypothetical protein
MISSRKGPSRRIFFSSRKAHLGGQDAKPHPPRRIFYRAKAQRRKEILIRSVRLSAMADCLCAFASLRA